MEKNFYVLRLCENHWKSWEIATTIYSQWHGRFVKKREAVKDEDNDLDWELAPKRSRVVKDDPSPGPVPSHNDAGGVPKAIVPIDPL